ncbi:MAG: hypothetical protein IKI04_01200 [Bacilli bacterium]|nr:hypothetical protein [Bacilli bacterium]
MKKEKDNILIYREKPYYTDDELRLYYKIAIDESLKQGNKTVAAHYQRLLDYLDKGQDTKAYNDVISHNKNKK